MSRTDPRLENTTSSRINPQLVQDFALALSRLLEAAATDQASLSETHAALGTLTTKTGKKLAYSIKEASEATGLGRNVLYQLVRSESFPSIRVGHKFIIPVQALERWLQDQVGAGIDTSFRTGLALRTGKSRR